MKRHVSMILVFAIATADSYSQNVGIGTTTPTYLTHIQGSPTSPITLYVNDMVTGSPRVGIQSNIYTTAASSVAIGGVVFDNGAGVSAIEASHYAIVGQTSTAIGVAGYTLSGTALRGRSGSGLALHTTGLLRFEGVSEGAGKVLTSDASGFANWQALPAGAGAWAANGNNIYNTNTGFVGINTAIPNARLAIRNPSADSNALLITHPFSRITRINGNRELYHEGNFWVHSAYGYIRLGYVDKGWYWGTINGGQDLQLWSHSTADVDGSAVERMVVEGTTGDVLINNHNNLDHAQLRVERAAGAVITTSAEIGAILGINKSTSVGAGVYGITTAARAGAKGYAGVSGNNLGSGSDRFGVIGQTNGTSAGGLYSAGVGGYGNYGVLGWSQSSTGAGMIAQHSAGKTALEVNNGFIKVSGTNKPAFTITATSGNSNSYILNLSYADQSQTDILIVTHNFNPPGGPTNYLSSPFSVYWASNKWTIYLDDFAPILNKSFNVLVIKQ